MLAKSLALGINEKALPQGFSWAEKMQAARQVGFTFMELSVDESDERLRRLSWSWAKREQLRQLSQQMTMPIKTLMLSALRRYPLGSPDPKTYQKAYRLACQGICLAHDLGCGNVQLAGYDVYYQEKSQQTQKLFLENLSRLIAYAGQKQVLVTLETMDDAFINSLEKIRQIKKQIRSPWLAAYADLGNLSAFESTQPQTVVADLGKNIDLVAAVHVKDTVAIGQYCRGIFKEVVFGTGDVDFAVLFQALYQLNYQGTVTVEMWSERDHDAIDQVTRAYDFINKQLKAVGYQLAGD